MPESIESVKYRMPLCPYLIVGNRRVLVHLDAFCVAQSLQWPKPGLPDRLGWRDPFDEWPYWEEMSEEAIRLRMPYFEYADGTRDFLHDADRVEIDYVESSNVLEGRYVLPGGAEIGITTFVAVDMDVWIRRYDVEGEGKLVLRGEFFEKAVRGHPAAHLGNVNFRGAFDAPPRGAYVIMCEKELPVANCQVELTASGAGSWTLFMSMTEDLKGAVEAGERALSKGFEALRDEAVAADRAWVAKAKEPISDHPFIRNHFKRWLLCNRLVTADDGAMACGPRPFWGLCWPRDCSLQVASYAAAGFFDEAKSVVKWHLDNTPESSVHEARYLTDGTPMLLDNRPRQGDNPGFLCWATAFILDRQWDVAWAESVKDKLYQLADHLVESRDPETLLPLPAADHRESELAESMGLVVTAAGGLKGAVRVAGKLGDANRAERYRFRAEEITRGAEKHLWNDEEGYFMQSVKPLREQADVAVCWGAYPLDVWDGSDANFAAGVERVFRDRWNAEVGGVLAGAGTSYESFWMYYATILLLGAGGIGAKEMEKEILDGLAENVSPQGLVPEQVSRATGNLWGCAPLPVAQACLLLHAYRR